MSDKMKNLGVRTLSGIVLGAVVLGAVIWSVWSFGALLALLLVAGMAEFYGLAEKRGGAPQRVIGTVTGLALFALNFYFAWCIAFGRGYVVLGDSPWLEWGLAFVLLLLPVTLVCELFRGRENPAADIGVTLLGVVYVALPFSLMCYIPVLAGEGWCPRPVLFYIFIVWANDVFAYLVGMTCGRHRLCERLSPKKSWEGFFGGLAGAVALGLAAAHVSGGDYAAWVGLALVAASTAVLGDLAESMFKRAADVKDSGRLIPGHGGVLDRFDAMLLSAPFVFVYMLFVM